MGAASAVVVGASPDGYLSANYGNARAGQVPLMNPSFAVVGTPAASGARGLVMIRAWLIALALLVLAMVALGGATRLTGSGLSITEWRPVTGAVPPLTQEAWLAEFAKYQQIPQDELLNRGMS